MGSFVDPSIFLTAYLTKGLKRDRSHLRWHRPTGRIHFGQVQHRENKKQQTIHTHIHTYWHFRVYY